MLRVHCMLRYHCSSGDNVMLLYMGSMFPAADNSDSPSIMEQSQQGHSSSCNSLLTVISVSVEYPIPYACQLAFCNVGYVL